MLKSYCIPLKRNAALSLAKIDDVINWGPLKFKTVFAWGNLLSNRNCE